MRSFQTNARIRSLTTGTFNRVVKDRIAFRLSGANSVQANSHKCESDCPRNLTNIPRCGKPCQRMHPTEFPPLFHNGNSGQRSRSQLNRQPKSQQTLLVCHSEPNPKFVIPNRQSRRGICFCLTRTLKRAQRYGLPLRETHISAQGFLGHARAEDRKLRKDLTFGGPCLEGTLQKPTGCFRIEPRGRGD